MLQINDLIHEVEKIYGWLIKVRRHFHMYPELSTQEFSTHDRIASYLKDMEIPYQSHVADTGVVGLIKGKYPGKTVALRGDIDALPILEENDVPYQSKHKGIMHACGHDAHTTIVLGAAKLLNNYKNELSGNVKLVFQPAEEKHGGAKRMVEAGVLDNPKVDAMFGLHVAADYPAGTINYSKDQVNASSDSIKLTIKGKNGHGAYPHKANDAIVAAGFILSQLQTIISRNVNPQHSAVLSFGKIEGGTQSNVIANKVCLEGTLRTLKNETRELIIERVKEIVTDSSKAMGCKAIIEIIKGYDPVINDGKKIRLLRKSATEILGEENVFTSNEISMGVEDFCYFSNEVPSAFWELGVRNEKEGIIHNVHDRKFDIDERALKVGVAIQVRNVLRFLHQGIG